MQPSSLSRAAAVGLSVSLWALSAPAGAEALTPLALKRVTLTAAGVAQLELEARVKDDAILSLQLRPDQIDDALKSLIIDDPAGKGSEIQLDAAEPLSRRLADGPIPEAGLGGPEALFDALRGARLRAGEVEGAILSVTSETVQGPGDSAVTKHRITLSTAEGLKSLLIEDAPTLKLVDPALNAGLERALAAVAAARETGPRNVTLRLTGTGERTVQVALLTAAPAWKTAWRLDLPAEPNKPARLQGWAIFENVTAWDWKDVTVALSSGAPAAFRQELWAARPVARPLAPPDVAAPLLPPVDPGAPQQAQVARAESRAMAPPPAPKPAPPPEPSVTMAYSLPPGAGNTVNNEIGRTVRSPVSLGAAAPEAETKSDGPSVRFVLPHPLTLAAGRSVSAPFLDRPTPAKTTLLLQPNLNRTNPLAGVDLRNDGTTAMPPGPLTVYRAGAWIGDARIGWLPPNESRVASFALDRSVRVSQEESRAEKLESIKAAQGVIETREVIRRTVTLTVAGTSVDANMLVVETPRRAVDEQATVNDASGATVALNGDAWRVSIPLPAKNPIKAEFAQTVDRKLQAGSIGSALILRLAGAAPDAASAAAFARAKELLSWKEDAEAEARKLEAERKSLIAEQERFRANLQATQTAPDLQRRYQKAMNDSEDRLATLQKEYDRRRAHADEAEKLLAEHLAALSL